MLCSCKESNSFVVREDKLKSKKVTECNWCYKKSIFNNLLNKTFGNLLVVERYLDYVSKSGYRSVRWKCRCSCGRSEDFPVHSSNFLSGKTTKCSICQYESVSLKKMKNIKGKKYGFLTPIEVDSVSSNGTYWRCLCECGGETVSLVSSIIRGTTKSCG